MSYVDAAREQLALYPESALKDLYKSFFQDACGAGHLLSIQHLCDLNDLLSGDPIC